jgi:hypothetical protein
VYNVFIFELYGIDMTTWTLIMVLAIGWRESVSIVIPNLPSYAECVRVEKTIRSGPIVDTWTSRADRGMDLGVAAKHVAQCIEVNK